MPTTPTSFANLALSAEVLNAISAVGYEQPSPIQAASIPPLLEGEDIIGMAQTGTGKTAAFALPVLSKIDVKKRYPQVLVLTPTRELAIQVAEAFQRYASQIPGFHVLPVYGGQGMRDQLRALNRGVHVIVGTPGRVMDHLRRETLKIDQLSTVILDEADEMLRMGFIDDVTWILDHTPEQRQVALFSATMPKAIRNVADRYLNNPVEVKIATETTTVEKIEQLAWTVRGTNKLDALTRILEIEETDASIIFVRTKSSTAELAERLEARGYAASALNGDMSQQLRERTIQRLKDGKIDIVVATDVAARGIDVARVSHVINYDIPYDTEAYVHRIGRTGRAGRSGKAILFVAPRERRLLAAIEKATKQRITHMELPTADQVTDKRIAQFQQTILDTIDQQKLMPFKHLITDLQQRSLLEMEDIAAALAYMAQSEKPLFIPKKDKVREAKPVDEKSTGYRRENDRGTSTKRNSRKGEKNLGNTIRYQIAVGHQHGVTPREIVGAIANEGNLSSAVIGAIKIHDSHSTVELPADLPKQTETILRNAWVCGQKLALQSMDSDKPARRETGNKRGDSRIKKRPAKSKASKKKNSATKKTPRKK